LPRWPLGSDLNARLADAQAPFGANNQFYIYGDAAYPNLSHIKRGLRGANLTAQDKAHNAAMSNARICVEWAFGEIVRDWAFVDYKKNHKLQLQQVGKLYFVAALLANCRCCLYGTKTSKYFDCTPPTLEEYARGILKG
jgi:hypothetical protein